VESKSIKFRHPKNAGRSLKTASKRYLLQVFGFRAVICSANQML
jgi:hypothetical protein